jgi:hypothetical protein
VAAGLLVLTFVVLVAGGKPHLPQMSMSDAAVFEHCRPIWSKSVSALLDRKTPTLCQYFDVQSPSIGVADLTFG